MPRRRSREQGCGSGGENFCDVISTLTHDLTKARTQLARLMQQVKPATAGGAGGARRLYGGYSTFQTPCSGRNRPRPMTVHVPNRQQLRPQSNNSCKKQHSSTTSDNNTSDERDSTCINITFEDSPERRPQSCPRQTKRASVRSQDPIRLQGGGSCRRHTCMGTQFATLLHDVTHQLRVRRLAADLVKPP